MAGIGKKKGKSPNKKKKEKKQKGDGSTIAAGILPGVGLAAAPRVPPPAPPPEFLASGGELGSSTGVLQTSMLHNFQTADGDQTSETDTSLRDYDNAKGTFPYSTASGSELGVRGMPGPPVGFADYDDSETEIRATPSPDDRLYAQPHAHQDVYAQPDMAAKRRSRSASPSIHDNRAKRGSSMQQFEVEEPNILRASGGSLRSTGSRGSGLGRPSSVNEDMESRVEAMMLNAEYAAPVRGSRPASALSADLSHTMSPKLQSLRDQNSDLLYKQRQMEEQLQSQKQLQEQILTRLAQHSAAAAAGEDGPPATLREVTTLLNDTQSVTETTLQRQEDLVQSLHHRSSILEEEKRELQEMNEQLQAEVNSVRRMTSYRDDDEQGGPAALLRKQLHDMKDECDTLKVQAIRLNAELSRYHAKYRPLSEAEREGIPGLPVRGPKPQWLINTKYLAPLFVAYDDRLSEKEEAIQHYQKELTVLASRVEEVLKENQRLHIRLEQTDISGPISMTEWRQLQEQCKLVLEENQLLMEQLQVQQNKTRDMHKAHVQEVSRLSQRVVAAEAGRGEMERERDELKEKVCQLRAVHDDAVVDNRTRVALEEHMQTIQDCKRTLEEEKTKHLHELQNIQTQMQDMSLERCAMDSKVGELQAENKTMQLELKSFNKAQRRSDKKVQLLQKALEESEVKEQTAEQYLSSVIRVAEKTVEERDNLSQTIHDRDVERKVAFNKVIEGKVANTKIEEKLKAYKFKASEKINRAISRMRDQDQDFSRQREEYEHEIKHLRLLMKEREEQMNLVSGEKKQVEDDLETMWQVASADNQRMKDTMRKSLRKLRDHTNVRFTLEDDISNEELIDCDSEVEKI